MRKVIRFIPVALALSGLSFLLWIIVSNVLVARDRSREKRTLADMRTIATAWEARATNTNSYAIGIRPDPDVASDVQSFGKLQSVTVAQLARVLEPAYAKKLPRVDAWGRPFDIRIGGFDKEGHAAHYAIRSSGKNRTVDADAYEPGTITDANDDLLFSDGTFVRASGAT